MENGEWRMDRSNNTLAVRLKGHDIGARTSMSARLRTAFSISQGRQANCRPLSIESRPECPCAKPEFACSICMVLADFFSMAREFPERLGVPPHEP